MRKFNLIIVICILIAFDSVGQTTTLSNTRASGSTAFLGWNNSGSAGPLEIRNDFTLQPINIFQGSSQVAYFNNGDFGLSANANGFQIQNNYVLWQNGGASNIYGGPSAGTFLGFNSQNTAFGAEAGYGSVSTTSAAIDNTFVGRRSGYSITTGYDNSFYGTNSGYYNTTGHYNDAFGSFALFTNTTGSSNCAFGQGTLYSNTSGVGNVALGNQSLYSNTTGTGNVAVGKLALFTNTTGNYNVAIGYSALQNFNSSIGSNVAIGPSALKTSTTGINNIAIGSSALEYLTTGYDNVAFGNQALLQTTTGYNNIGIGSGALSLNTIGTDNIGIGNSVLTSNVNGVSNTAIGSNSLVANTASNNTALGYYTLRNNTTGAYNIAVGGLASFNVTTGSNNCTFGYESMYNNTSGTKNCAFGNYSLLSNTNASYNSAFGYEALNTNTTGSTNNAFGYQALKANTTGSANAAFGYQSLYSCIIGTNNCAFGYYSLGATSGTGNTGVGYSSGTVNSNGSYNTFIGYGSNSAPNILINNGTAIGSNAIVAVSNNMILGDNNTKVGINLSGDATGALSTLSIGGNGNTLYTTYSYNSATASNGASGLVASVATPTLGGLTEYAIQGIAVPGTVSTNVGVLGSSYRSTAAAGSNAWGVFGQAGNGQSGYNFGVYGRILGSNNGAGIVSSITGTPTVPGIYSAYFSGDIRTTDDSPEKPSGGSWVTACDARVKTDVSNFTDGLNVLRQITPKNYRYNGIGEFPTAKMNVGVLANEVQPIAPYCIGKSRIIVKEDEKANFINDIVETLGQDSAGNTLYIAEILNYNQDPLFYVMVNSIKQLDSTIKSMDSTITALQGQINGSSSNRQGQNIDTLSTNGKVTHQVTLSNGSDIILYQNQPNPFENNTVIKYFIPETVTGSAFIVFQDGYGNEINKLEIIERGFGKIDVTANDLTSGIYSYSLIIYNKIVETKKMIKSK